MPKWSPEPLNNQNTAMTRYTAIIKTKLIRANKQNNKSEHSSQVYSATSVTLGFLRAFLKDDSKGNDDARKQ